MAEIKISELTSASTPLAGTEIVPIVQGGVTKQVAVSEIGGGGGATWGGITGTLSSQTDLQTALDSKQDDLILTTTGTSGAATLVGSTLNIPQYGSGVGKNTPFQMGSGKIYSNIPIGGGNTNLSPSANSILMTPFQPSYTFTTSNMFINVSTLAVGVSARILLYSHSVANGLPDQKLYESSDLDCSTTGIKTATTSQTFIAGTTYWLGIYANGSPSFAGASVASLLQIGMDAAGNQYTSISRTVTFGSAPTTWGTTANNYNSSILRIGLTIQ